MFLSITNCLDLPFPLQQQQQQLQPDRLRTLVIKIDVEGRECDMILASDKSFLPDENLFVAIIFMEWRFNDFGANVCSKDKLKVVHVV